jgi:hypothetical protein
MVTIHQPGDKVYTMDDEGHILEFMVSDSGDLRISEDSTTVRTDQDIAADPETPGVMRSVPPTYPDAERATHAMLAHVLAGMVTHTLRIPVEELAMWSSQEIKFMQFGDSPAVYARLVIES